MLPAKLMNNSHMWLIFFQSLNPSFRRAHTNINTHKVRFNIDEGLISNWCKTCKYQSNHVLYSENNCQVSMTVNKTDFNSWIQISLYICSLKFWYSIVFSVTILCLHASCFDIVFCVTILCLHVSCCAGREGVGMGSFQRLFYMFWAIVYCPLTGANLVSDFAFFGF